MFLLVFVLAFFSVLSMVAGPAHAAVDMGSWVDFECAVTGNLMESVNWTRDFGKLRKDKVFKICANFFCNNVKF